MTDGSRARPQERPSRRRSPPCTCHPLALPHPPPLPPPQPPPWPPPQPWPPPWPPLQLWPPPWWPPPQPPVALPHPPTAADSLFLAKVLANASSGVPLRIARPNRPTSPTDARSAC